MPTPPLQALSNTLARLRTGFEDGGHIDRAMEIARSHNPTRANGKKFSPASVHDLLLALARKGLSHSDLTRLRPHFEDGGGEGGGESGGEDGESGSGESGGEGAGSEGGGNEGEAAAAAAAQDEEAAQAAQEEEDAQAAQAAQNAASLAAALGETSYGSFGLSGPVGGVGAATAGLGPGATSEENLGLNANALTDAAQLTAANPTTSDIFGEPLATTSFAAQNAGSPYGDLSNISTALSQPNSPLDYDATIDVVAPAAQFGQTGYGTFGLSGPVGTSGAAQGPTGERDEFSSLLFDPTLTSERSTQLTAPNPTSAEIFGEPFTVPSFAAHELGPINVHMGEKPTDIAPEYADIPALTIHGGKSSVAPDATILGPTLSNPAAVEVLPMSKEQIAEIFPNQQPQQVTQPAERTEQPQQITQPSKRAEQPQQTPQGTAGPAGAAGAAGAQGVSPTSFADVQPGGSGVTAGPTQANVAPGTTAPRGIPLNPSWASSAPSQQAEDKAAKDAQARALARALAATRTSGYQGRSYSPQVVAATIPTRSGMQQQTVGDQIAMARAILGEGRGENRAGQIAIAHTIANRAQALASTGAANRGSAGSQANAPSQFSWHIPAGDRTGSNRAAVAAAERNNTAAWQQAMDIVRGVISGDIQDPTHGATFYHNQSVQPYWATARGMSPTTNIGQHSFYSYAPWASVRSQTRGIPNIDQSRPNPPANIPNVGPRASVEPSIADRAMAFLSQFNPVGTAAAAESKFGAPAWVGGSPQQAWQVAQAYQDRLAAAQTTTPSQTTRATTPVVEPARQVTTPRTAPVATTPRSSIQPRTTTPTTTEQQQARQAVAIARALEILGSGGNETWRLPTH